MIDRFSLRWRIPAIMALILIGAVVTLSILAYRAARDAAITSSRERLANAADRVAAATGTAIVTVKERALAAARSPLIIDALKNPGKPLSDDAQAVLKALRTDTVAPLKIAVLDLQGRPVEGVVPELAREGPVELLAPVDSPTVHPLRAANGVMEWVVAVPVRDNGRLIGQIVQWRRLTRVTQSVRTVSDLIGPEALLLLGNADGTALTEFHDTLHPPVVRDAIRARQAQIENTQVSAAISGTPWAWYVEYPYAAILGPIQVLSWQSILVAIGVLLLAILAGTLMSRGMTQPLTHLTHTAEFIAAGDLTRRPLETTRRDEIGRLARSFSIMAERVRESHETLEKRIEARTADLKTAMNQLQDAQDELVRKEKLATIGQLASSVGHELRNPLGVMSNAIYILERSIESPTPRVDQYLRLVSNQIKLSERIVSDLLDSTRNQSPQRRDVDVHTLLHEQLSRVTIPSHIEVKVAVDENLPKMHVDPDQVGQILVNLFTNASQAMDGDGERRPGTLSIHARNGDGRVRIDVRDTGPGVSSQHVEKIFEPLYTTKARGIGLGLSVSRSLAVANRGTLSVLNHPDGGAVFTLDLPTSNSN